MQLIKIIVLYLIGFVILYFIADWLKENHFLTALLMLFIVHAISLIYQKLGLYDESLKVRVNEENRLKKYVENLENYVFKLEDRIEKLENKS